MRRPAGLGYLLARMSDTVADAATPDPSSRIEALDGFAAAIDGRGSFPTWSDELLRAAAAHPGELALLRRGPELEASLLALPEAEAGLVREVVRVILGGQRLDLVRFSASGPQRPVALADAAELEDYAYRVAGCVGAFWTRLGFLTLGPRFSRSEPAILESQGVSLGKALQLVNILRDMPEDLARGRCYLPVPEPADRAQLLAAHARWLETAREWLRPGFAYAASQDSRRLRAAALLPARLAQETLDLMEGADWQRLASRVKVPRHRVRRLAWTALLGPRRRVE